MEDFTGWMSLDKDDIIQQINEGGITALKAICEKKQNEWKNVPLNVAVTGNPGTGKSSFINAIRGLDGDDEGAAKVDEIEATVDVRSYPHPANTNLQFWDLPGVGTPRFPQATYLEVVGFDRYDFFLILSRDRFTENDMWLATEIHSRQKKFFFVRTKIDYAVDGDKRGHKKTHNEAVLLARIKQYCVENLSVIEFIPDVFLISSYDKHKFDFKLLTDKLIADFPALKREALILYLNIMTEQVIREKAEVLRKRVWHTAALSAAFGAIPIPGLSAVVDLVLIEQECVFYRKQFGLDDESLAVAAREANMSLDVLKLQFTKFFSIENIARCLGVITVSEAAEKGALILIPIIGNVIAAGISYKVTASYLYKKIDDSEDVSLKVTKYLTSQMSSSFNEEATGQDM